MQKRRGAMFGRGKKQKNKKEQLKGELLKSKLNYFLLFSVFLVLLLPYSTQSLSRYVVQRLVKAIPPQKKKDEGMTTKKETITNPPQKNNHLDFKFLK